MNRRFFLALLTRLIGLGTAVAAAIPGLRLLLDPLRQKGSAAKRYRVAPLEAIPPGTPVRFAVRGQRIDAWKVFPEQILGYVWVFRAAESGNGGEPHLRVFSATCPHLGCTVDYRTDKSSFLCPCHGGAFTNTGDRIPDETLGYKNPAPRGLDPLPYELVRDETGKVWLEVEFQRFELNTPERKPIA